MKSWQFMCSLYIATAVVCAGLAYLAGPSWTGMLDAALFGFNLGTALGTWHSARWRALFERSQATFKEMADLNDALIHNRVMFHLFGETPPLDPSDDQKPRLH